MEKLKICSFAPKDVIVEMAEAMDVSYSNNGIEYELEVPRPWGEGHISAVQFEGGFGLLKYDCTFHEDVEVCFTNSNNDPLKFLYCLEGKLQVRFEDREELFTLEKYHNSIMGRESRSGHVFKFPEKTKVRIRSIEIDRPVFHDRFNCDETGCHSQVQKIFDDHSDEEVFYEDGMYSVTLSDLFDRLDAFSHGGVLRTVYLEGTILKILSYQLVLYEDDLYGKNEQNILRSYELHLIHKAAGIIEDELEDLETIPVLAHRVGMNINKIQDGFKLLYNMTVNQYIHKARMNQATTLLRYSDNNISEIVNKLGLSSKSYFSKIFRDAYGVTPTEYRKKKRKMVS